METTSEKHPYVLIVEDDPGHQRLLQLYIQRTGANCDCCFDGRAGLEAATSNHYDMIFIDIHIPEMDGFMLATQLRDRGYTTPLIAITALKLEEMERKALAVGFNAFLLKPIQQEAITEIEQRFLSTQKT